MRILCGDFSISPRPFFGRGGGIIVGIHGPSPSGIHEQHIPLHALQHFVLTIRFSRRVPA
jgi:hypothetical protein